jgi:glutamine amidotransferase
MLTAALIDYGSGNLASAAKALSEAARRAQDEVRVLVTDRPEEVAAADHIVLPGVGAFGHCMAQLQARPGLIEAMDQAVHRRAVPFLGVCVGMQLMAERGLEFGVAPGLGWIGGQVKRIEPSDRAFKVPHMGWNALADIAPHPVFAGLEAGDHMYFTHSFAFYPEDRRDIAARADHGGVFTAAVARDNKAGVQFHPEKSQAAGLRLLSNFLEWRP